MTCDKLWKHLQRLGILLHFQQAVKTMYSIIYAKAWTNGDTHGVVMLHRCLKNDVHSLPPLFDLYTDEFEIYLDEINGDSMCLFNTMVTIPLYVDNVVMLSRSCICLKRLLTNYMRFCTSSRLEVKPTMTKIMIFGCNNRKFNQEAFYLDKDQIEITHEYDYLGIDFDLHNYFEPSDKRQGIACVKALRGTLKKKW